MSFMYKIQIHHTVKCFSFKFSWSLYGEFWKLNYKCQILKLGYKYFNSLLISQMSDCYSCQESWKNLKSK